MSLRLWEPCRNRRGGRLARALLLGAVFTALPSAAFADGGHGIGAEVWLLFAAILLAAKLGAELAVRLGQPAVLGELVAGIVLGNADLLPFVGTNALSSAAALPSVEFLAELGVVLLLFEVGLESTLLEMKRVAPQSGLVAVIGVVAPMALGYATSAFLMPEADTTQHLFVCAALCATSVGITARVLQELGAMDRQETKVVLGAAVIDDVLGLLVLAVVSAIAVHGSPNVFEIAKLSALAVGFLIGALLLGTYVMPGVFRTSSKLQSPGVLAALSVAFCFLLAGASAASGLAAIVGAFAAGLVLDEVHVIPFGKTSKHDLSELVRPIVTLVAPIFFVRTGMLVDLAAIPANALVLAAALSVVAIAGKLVAGLGMPKSKGDRLLVGIGMIPRGEVGLIFANVGASILVGPEKKPIVDAATFGAIVLMVMVTTVVSPPWIGARLRTLAARSPAAS